VLRTTGTFLRDQDVCAPSIVIGDQFRASCVIHI